MPVYAIQAGENGPVKLGKADDPVRRMAGLQTGNAQELHLLRVWAGGEAEEAALHKRFAGLRLFGEWFGYSPDFLRDVGLQDITDRYQSPRARRRHRDLSPMPDAKCLAIAEATQLPVPDARDRTTADAARLRLLEDWRPGELIFDGGFWDYNVIMQRACGLLPEGTP